VLIAYLIILVNKRRNSDGSGVSLHRAEARERERERKKNRRPPSETLLVVWGTQYVFLPRNRTSVTTLPQTAVSPCLCLTIHNCTLVSCATVSLYTSKAWKYIRRAEVQLHSFLGTRLRWVVHIPPRQPHPWESASSMVKGPWKHTQSVEVYLCSFFNLGAGWKVNGHSHGPAALPPGKWAGRVQLKRDGTRWRTGGEVKGKLANGVGSQYSSHYLGTRCIQHYYRWCAHLGCQ